MGTTAGRAKPEREDHARLAPARAHPGSCAVPLACWHRRQDPKEARIRQLVHGGRASSEGQHHHVRAGRAWGSVAIYISQWIADLNLDPQDMPLIVMPFGSILSGGSGEAGGEGAGEGPGTMFRLPLRVNRSIGGSAAAELSTSVKLKSDITGARLLADTLLLASWLLAVHTCTQVSDQ